VAITKQEIEALSEMVVAGGKSPATGGQGMMQAAALIQVLQREANQEQAFASAQARIAELEAQLAESALKDTAA
jgi:hypothetical protein